MPTTRSASRTGSAATTPSSSPQAKAGGAGTKRKAESTPTKAKRSKTEEKPQKTLEETLKKDEPVKSNDVEMKEDNDISNGDAKHDESKQEPQKPQSTDAASREEKAKPSEDTKSTDKPKEESQSDKASGDASTKDETSEQKTEDANPPKDQSNGTAEHKNETAGAEPNGSAVETDESRKKAEPSNILEKGMIYFFFRGRVNISDPSSVSDIQRSYILLRPLPSGASLGEGPVPSGGKARILALPKKALPKSPNDRFLCWVEAANSSFDDIKKSHLERSEYSTQTAGGREMPAAQPAAEGIYAITTTGRESHLAYIITVPDEVGEVQKELGLNSRGAFITSVKNPETSAPAGTAPDAKAEYSKDIMDDFRGLRWGRLEPRHLDYKDCQFLLIGENEDDKLEKSVKADEGDGTKPGKEEPKEELELLEKEDEERIKKLSGDDSDAIFRDLGLSKDEFSKVKTEW